MDVLEPLAVDYAENYHEIEWFDLQEIECITQRPFIELKGLPLYYKQEGWTDITQDGFSAGKIFLSGFYLVTTISSEEYSWSDAFYGTRTERRRHLKFSCVLAENGMNAYKVNPEVFDNIELICIIENTKKFIEEFSENSFFNVELECDAFSACANMMFGRGLIQGRAIGLYSHKDAIAHYCQQFGVYGYEERMSSVTKTAQPCHELLTNRSVEVPEHYDGELFSILLEVIHEFWADDDNPAKNEAIEHWLESGCFKTPVGKKLSRNEKDAIIKIARPIKHK